MKTGENKHTYLTALEEYINNVYVLVLLLVPGACQCAGIVYTLEKALGWLPSVSLAMLVIFDITCLLYLLIGIFLVKTGFRDGIVRKDRLKTGKIFIVLCMFIQFNFILYMIPSTDFWGFAFFFVILTSLFIDLKMVIAATVEIVGSLITAWLIYGKVHLPANDEYFNVNLFNRIICVALSLPTLILFTYLIGRFLVNAKKDETERNEILESQLKRQVEHYNRTEQLNNSLREFRHDYRNHITSIRSLARSGDYKAIIDYTDNINELSEPVTEYRTGHRIADAILSDKAGCGEIPIKFEGCIPPVINNVDMCIILGNALDNAYRACSEIEGCSPKTITVTAACTQGYFTLLITNPVAEDIHFADGFFPVSTKHEKWHGLGLNNIKRVCDKYQGSMELYCKDKLFKLFISLNIHE